MSKCHLSSHGIYFMHTHQFSSLSHVWLFATPWTAVRQASLSIAKSHAQTHVHQVGDAIQPCHPLSSPSAPAFNLSQHQGLFQWISSSHQVARVLEFQLQLSVLPMNIQDWLMDWLDLLAVQGTLKSLLQHDTVQLSHPYMTTGKTIALIRWTLVGKVMSLLFNTLSTFVISSKEKVSFNFIAAVTICSDFEAQENKVCHCFHSFPIYLPWSNWTACHDLCFLNVEF